MHRFKKVENWHFSKGVSPWFLVKNWKFCPFLVFQQSSPEQSVLWPCRSKSSHFTRKKDRFKKSKFCIFLKGIVHDFSSNIRKFLLFCQQNSLKESGLWRSRWKTIYFIPEKRRFQKGEIWHFSKGVSPWFLVKNWKFCPF